MKKVGLIFIFLLLILPRGVKAVTLEEYNDAVYNVAVSAATTYADEFVYSFYWGGTPDNPENKKDLLGAWLKEVKKGIKIKEGFTYGSTKAKAGIQGSFKNKFPVYCGTFVDAMVYHASGGQVTMSDYYKIKASELRHGDIIKFKNHDAIFIDDAHDNSDWTWTVAEASSKIRVTVTTREPEVSGYRIKDSVLAKLDYNAIMASYDFHDRLDDYAPIIQSVTEIDGTNRIQILASDYKHYELAEHSDILEPESNGIVAYKVSKSSVTPTTDWKKVNKTNILNIQEEVEGNGTYYVYVKDIGGNVTKKMVNLTKIYIDTELPTLGEFSYESSENSIEVTVTGAIDNKGIKEYRYYLDGELIGNSSDNNYLIGNLATNREYNFYYEVVDNSNNVVKSMDYKIETELSAESIEVADKELYLIIGGTYRIEPQVTIDSNNYRIKYKSSDNSIVSVSEIGEINCLSKGKATVTVSVGKTKVDIQVTVSSHNIIFDVNEFPVAYIGEEYNLKMGTTPDSEISVINSELPKGLRIVNNTIIGTPEENTSGEYEMIFLAKDNESEISKKYSFYVRYNVVIQNDKLTKAYLNKEYSEQINVNYPASISIVNGELPDGLNIVNGKIAGTPTTPGEYNFTIQAEYKNSTFERDYTLVVSRFTIYDYLIMLGVIVLIIVIAIMVKKNIEMKKLEK